MPFEKNIEYALAQSADYYWEALKNKPSMEEAFSRIGDTSYPSQSTIFEKKCWDGMKIIMSLCESKFSERFIQGLLPVFYNLLDTTMDLSKQEILDKLHEIYQNFLDWKKETTIYFPVVHIKVSGENAIQLGNVSFWNFSALLKKRQHAPSLDKALETPSQEGIPETVASFSMIAELQRTKEIGKQAIIDVLNVIQFVNPTMYVHNQTPHFLLAENALRQYASVFSEDEGKIRVASSYLADSAMDLYLPLSGKHREIWKNAYGDDAIAIMQSQATGELAEVLKRAIYWYAAGERESSYERAFIYYTMSLEAIFTEIGGGVSTQGVLADSLALILGKNLDERLAIKKLVKDLYKSRSRLTHGGEDPVRHLALERQRYLSYSAIKFVLSKRNEFRKRSDITAYIEKLKFSLPITADAALTSKEN